MKNPFKKSNPTGLIAVILLSSVVAGTIAYFYLTETGEELRRKTKEHIKKIAKEQASKAISKKTGLPQKAVQALADHLIK